MTQNSCELKSHTHIPINDHQHGFIQCFGITISRKITPYNLTQPSQSNVIFNIIPRSHSYCLSLPLCLEWYNGSITPRVHSGDPQNKHSVRLRPPATVGISVLNNCLEWDKFVRLTLIMHLSHSRQSCLTHANPTQSCPMDESNLCPGLFVGLLQVSQAQVHDANCANGRLCDVVYELHRL